MPEATQVGHDRAGAPRSVQQDSLGTRGGGSRQTQAVGGWEVAFTADLCPVVRLRALNNPPGWGDSGGCGDLDTPVRTASRGGSTWETHTPPPALPPLADLGGRRVSLPVILPAPGNTERA